MAIVLDISRKYNVPHSKIKSLLGKIELSPFDDISEKKIAIIESYANKIKETSVKKPKNRLQLYLRRKKKKKSAGKNPLNPNNYIYKKIRIINVSIGGKTK